MHGFIAFFVCLSCVVSAITCDADNALKFNLFGYIGQPSNSASGAMILGGYRSYSPQHQIFLKQDSDDPFLSMGTSNGYAYSAGNPINDTDPTGHMPQGALDLSIGTGLALLTTLASAGKLDYLDAGLFTLGNTAPAAISSVMAFAHHHQTEGMSQAIIAIGGLLGSISAQPDLFLAAENKYRSAFVKASAMSANTLYGLSAGLSLPYGHANNTMRIGMVIATSLSGLGAGLFYDRMSQFVERSEYPGFYGSIRTGFTGLIAGAPANIYTLATHQHKPAWQWALNVAAPFGLGALSGLTQAGYRNNYLERSFENNRFLGYSAARMSYLFIRPPVWAAISSGHVESLL